MLAVHNYASEHQDRLPTWNGGIYDVNRGESLFEAILPQLEQGKQYLATVNVTGARLRHCKTINYRTFTLCRGWMS